MAKETRKKFGTNVVQPKPFTAFIGKDGTVGVRIAKSKPFVSGQELIVSASPVRVVNVDGALVITGEGVVRRHGGTIAVTP